MILFGFFIFSFLHSELGLLDYDGDDHGAHDYCQIVKNTNTHSKILQEELPRLELNKEICFHCFEEIETQKSLTLFEKNDHRINSKPFNNLYLFNNTFLI